MDGGTARAEQWGSPRRRLGDEAEQRVAAYLSERGFTLEATNHACRFGEVDLIARRGELWCFVEVRMRASSTFGAPAGTVSRGKQRRIAVAALDFLQRRRLHNRVEVRFDVVSVVGRGEAAQIEHLPGAFESPF
jgi:putative endonuclease